MPCFFHITLFSQSKGGHFSQPECSHIKSIRYLLPKSHAAILQLLAYMIEHKEGIHNTWIMKLLGGETEIVILGLSNGQGF